MNIRRAVRPDAGALAVLAAITFPLATTPATEQAEIDRHVEAELSEHRFAGFLADPSRHLWVAEVAGELVGYTMLVEGEPEDPAVIDAITARPTIELGKFYVHPDHHGLGIAGLLMDEVVRVGRSAGAASLWLGVSDENARANRFYEKHGFVIVGAKQFRIGDRFENDHVRELVL